MVNNGLRPYVWGNPAAEIHASAYCEGRYVVFSLPFRGMPTRSLTCRHGRAACPDHHRKSSGRRATQFVWMTTPSPKLTAVTLGVRDVPASARFYEALGFKRKVRSTGDEIAFFEAGGVILALWDWDKLAEDTVISSQPRPQTFRGATMAWNCATPAEVDAVFAKAIAAGAGLLRRPEKTEYGGYRGYFSDPDGHAWEVV